MDKKSILIGQKLAIFLTSWLKPHMPEHGPRLLAETSVSVYKVTISTQRKASYHKRSPSGLFKQRQPFSKVLTKDLFPAFFID